MTGTVTVEGAPFDMNRGGWDAIPADIWTSDLTANAIRLLGYLQSRPPGWLYYETAVIEAMGYGRHALLGARRCLREAGLVRVIQQRTADGGFAGTVLQGRWSTSDPWPTVGPVIAPTGTTTRGSVTARSENRGSRKSDPLSHTDVYSDGEELVIQNGAALVCDSPDSEFEDFWRRYPSRNGRKPGKRAAKKRWGDLGAGDRVLASEVVARYETFANGYPVDCERWLNRRSRGVNFTDHEDWVIERQLPQETEGQRNIREAVEALKGHGRRDGVVDTTATVR